MSKKNIIIFGGLSLLALICLISAVMFQGKAIKDSGINGCTIGCFIGSQWNGSKFISLKNNMTVQEYELSIPPHMRACNFLCEEMELNDYNWEWYR